MKPRKIRGGIFGGTLGVISGDIKGDTPDIQERTLGYFGGGAQDEAIKGYQDYFFGNL